ncbi:hypothetical protein PPERSA_04294 [Pseudocohnilembus persalinus]|uniref:Uncharacterized protein n=1 Tax=Pseudocohnilembus persalinus TaxID=266149 RepID=A0A0V0QNU3_PSEPJ|nr:hypothetical protein PPERSA_04294 [Pseudocohnilembus persalinus]|eukprot:KRX03786.1 hypothetical protein PPERSA_04294 [Pseudocohnilembus persalinus]
MRSRLNLIEMEIDSYQDRIDRLKLKDGFKEGLSERPRPTAINEKKDKLYAVQIDDELHFSNLDKTDIEVYLRSYLHQNKVNRNNWKLFYIKVKPEDSDNYVELKKSFEIFPVYPSISYEQKQLIKKFCSKTFKGLDFSSSNIQVLIYEVGLMCPIIYKRNLELTKYKFTDTNFSENLAQKYGISKEQQANEDGIEFSYEEFKKLQQHVIYKLSEPKTIQIIKADWEGLYEFEYVPDEYEQIVIDTLQLQDNIDPLAKQFQGQKYFSYKTDDQNLMLINNKNESLKIFYDA